MHYTLTPTRPAMEAADCVIVGIFQGMKLSQAADELDQASNGYLRKLLAQGDLVPKLGNTLLLHAVPSVATARVLLVYCGDIEGFKSVEFRKVTACMADVIKSIPLSRVASYITDIGVGGLDFCGRVRQTIELTEASLYVFDRFKSKKTDRMSARSPKEMAFHVEDGGDLTKLKKLIRQTAEISSGIKFAKDLANLPANVCTPRYMAEQAKRLAQEAGFGIRILGKAELIKKGMGALLAVAQGSAQPPKLVVLEYHGAKKKAKKPIVLIGKGVTFDAGGLCLKPAPGMEEMKFDMSGAASVLGVFKVLSLLKLPLNVIGVMPLTENLPSGTAIKPGDVVKSLSGQTIEVINTDAEGRLILADALTYSACFNPDAVIDVATLTGAIIVALGGVASGLMGNDAALTQELEKAGKDSGDRVWPLPLWDDYQEQIDSNIADVSNIGLGGGKSITAACFLSRFADQFSWAHLDIAGTAWKSGKDKMATGRPVALLVQFLMNRCDRFVQ